MILIACLKCVVSVQDFRVGAYMGKQTRIDLPMCMDRVGIVN